MEIRRLSVSLVLVTTTMFVLSYIWHGVILNDFYRLGHQESKVIFLIILVYLIIGFIIVKVVERKPPKRRYKNERLMNGMLVGGICGISFFIISTVSGFTLNTGTGVKNMLVNILWQIVEQGAGGIAASFSLLFGIPLLLKH